MNDKYRKLSFNPPKLDKQYSRMEFASLVEQIQRIVDTLNREEVAKLVPGSLIDMTVIDGLNNALTAKADKAISINTTAPLYGGGNLSGDRNLSITQSNSTTDGFLSNTDWNTFNGKQDALGFTPVPDTREIATDAPLSGGGSLTANLTLSITQAGSTSNGYLSSSDWTAFNNKLDSIAGLNHATLSNLSYADSGHTGFSPDTHNHDSAYAAIGRAIPAGGTEGQVLAKASATDYDTEWVDQTGGGGGRELLTADRTYYVRTDGNDSNDGLTNSAGGAFLTIQKAVSVIISTLDIAGYNVSIQLADGTYSGAIVVTPPVGGGRIYIKGNSSTPTNVVVSHTGTTTIFNNGTSPTILYLQDFKVETSGGSFLINGTGHNTTYVSNLVFGAATVFLRASYGAFINMVGNCAIAGNATFPIQAVYAGIVQTISRTITITGTPAFTAFCYVEFGFYLAWSMTFSGSATGARYQVVSNGIINTAGGGAKYFPGDSAGVVSSGGQYL